ncbi:hypothetical protein K505DRAFT_330870 [Melanomma pulvis-pyrius CBS 109.77]|uniref:Uncharacterized protein n=1 Tax=Melanomma pulvis-pyrius CBS 109.77 TaxID=1314802 RepID=A0A6A6WP38_9PLEO|nr:hypothetical protein K505DRAFT_330870 [Melanomma pulvis-pyrius CBS 109.77]
MHQSSSGPILPLLPSCLPAFLSSFLPSTRQSLEKPDQTRWPCSFGAQPWSGRNSRILGRGLPGLGLSVADEIGLALVQPSGVAQPSPNPTPLRSGAATENGCPS